MGWMGNVIQRIRGSEGIDWLFIDQIRDPGLGISGKELKPDDCYVEVYIESLRLEWDREFATTFRSAVYSFISLPQEGNGRATLASITTPDQLKQVTDRDCGRVLTIQSRVLHTVPWRGGPLSLELGLFSVRTGNLLEPVLKYVANVASKAGVSIAAAVDPFLPLITEGLDIIAGQTNDSKLEVALDADVSPEVSHLSAVIATRKETLKRELLTIDPEDRKLLYEGEPLAKSYFVFSIRQADRNNEWAEIPALVTAFDLIKRAIIANKRQDALEAQLAFNLQLVACPYLIEADQTRLRAKAQDMMAGAFPGGGQAVDVSARKYEDLELFDLNLYDE